MYMPVWRHFYNCRNDNRIYGMPIFVMVPYYFIDFISPIHFTIQNSMQSPIPCNTITEPFKPEKPLNVSTTFPEQSSSRQCRICLLTTDSKRKPLISPCHCSGTVRHVHIHCLAHWIEVSSRKAACINSNRYSKPPPPHCELCGFRYRRRPFVDVS